ncbi:MAG: hypothetical protein VYA84_09480 [Planctomycetota bacterium]|nr:hypothetical protein [Planctomycetota bacterium]
MSIFETNQDAAEFLGWCTIFNIVLMTFSMVILITMRDRIAAIHGRLFDLEPLHLKGAYFRYLANYKLLTLVFNAIPYVALKLCG